MLFESRDGFLEFSVGMALKDSFVFEWQTEISHLPKGKEADATPLILESESVKQK